MLDLRLALSREPGTPKTYVQNKMLDDRSQICELITRADKPAWVYVCGSVKRIGAGVHSALIEILTAGQGMTESDAQNWLEDAEHAGRYHRDVWG